MSDTSKDFQEARERYRPLLERALLYFLEDEGAVRQVASSALEQAGRQWKALEGEANLLHVIGLAAADQCKLLLPRSIFAKRKPTPTAAQVIRHIEWYDWEVRIEELQRAIDVKTASARESGGEGSTIGEINALNVQLKDIVQTLVQSKLGMSDDDENAAGGIVCEIPPTPPMRGPGNRREFADALAAPRNP